MQRDQVVDRTGFLRREVELRRFAQLDLVDAELLPDVLRLSLVEESGTLGCERSVERVFNPSRKDTHWGKRKLARDR
jgi:hypothetical protein